MKKQSVLLKELGDTVRARRLKAGYSQEEFSNRAGLHRTYISHLEQGLRNPTYVTLQKIAEALECTVEELLGSAR